jgi:hypothetical protein
MSAKWKSGQRSQRSSNAKALAIHQSSHRVRDGRIIVHQERIRSSRSFVSLRRSDLPKIEPVMVEVPNPGHPYGAKGAAEVNMGNCEPPGFDSAGGYFNPANAHHGMMAGPGHAGDMPNLHVPVSGVVDLEVLKHFDHPRQGQP